MEITVESLAALLRLANRGGLEGREFREVGIQAAGRAIGCDPDARFFLVPGVMGVMTFRAAEPTTPQENK